MNSNLDIAQLRKNRGRLCAFIMGLISSIYGLLISLITGIPLIFGDNYFGVNKYSSDTAIAIGILVILTSGVCVVGASLIRTKRNIGGILMMLTAIPLLVVSVLDSQTFSFLGIIGVVSIAAAIIAFIPLSESYWQKYIAKNQYQASFDEYVANQNAVNQQQ